MKFSSLPVFYAFSLILIPLILLNGCDVTSNNDDDHVEAVGFVIDQNDAEILRFEQNEYIWNPSETWDDYYRDEVSGMVISPDVIELTGDEPSGMTPGVRIRWIDPDGEVFDLPDLSEEEGGEYWLDWEWEKPNVLVEECSQEAREDIDAIQDGAIRPANLEQHGSDGQWGFHFRADHAGEDRIRFKLMHGSGGAAHADFISGWMNLVVPHDEHEQIDENGIYHHVRDKCRTR